MQKFSVDHLDNTMFDREEHTMIREAVITIPVDVETARVYQTASTEERKKIQLLLRLQLRELIGRPKTTLREVMDDIGTKAQARGLTPEILETLLHAD